VPIYSPTRGRLLVRNIITDDKVGKILLLEKTRGQMTGLQVEVEATGAPWWNEEDEVHETIPAESGWWVVLKDRWCRVPTEDPDLFVIGIDDLAGRFSHE